MAIYMPNLLCIIIKRRGLNMITALWLTYIDKNRLLPLINDLDYNFIIKCPEEAKDEDYKEAEVLIGRIPIDKISLAKTAKWIQLEYAGVDSYKNIGKDIILTNCSGAYGEIIAEYMLCFILLSQNSFLDYYELQTQRHWQNIGQIKSIKEISILSVGMGDIGSSLAKKVSALGAKVSGVRRNKHDKPDYIDHLYTFEELDEAIKEYDVIAISLPETKETYHLFDYERLKSIKKDAVLINVGRGSVFNTTDLLRVIKEKHFSHVFLDVFEEEPLPINNELWYLDNVHITPHITGNFNADITIQKAIDIIKRNLLHYQNDEPLENIVDKDLGY